MTDFHRFFFYIKEKREERNAEKSFGTQIEKLKVRKVYKVCKEELWNTVKKKTLEHGKEKKLWNTVKKKTLEHGVRRFDGFSRIFFHGKELKAILDSRPDKPG